MDEIKAALSAEPALRIDYSQLEQQPKATEDLEKAIDKTITRLKTVRLEVEGGYEGESFRDILRSFAEECRK